MEDEGIAGSAGISGGDETVEAAGCSQQSSPKGGKVKFFCSHGGKILPRPSDGVLKYVGGETRVVGVPRTISFSDLMKKITELCEGEFVIKYQIGSVDLDALVSVKTDEDLQYMLDEYDRLESTSNPKLRVFLFPATIKVSTNQQQLPFLSIPQSLEQRYLDAINGIVRTSSTPPVGTRPPMTQSRLRSVCTSPSDSGTPSPHSPSPPSMVAQNSLHNLASVTTTPDPNNIAVNLRGKLTRMHKVHSSPSLCSLGGGMIQNSNTYQLGGGNAQFKHGRVAYPGSLYGHGYHHQQQQLLHQHTTHYHNRSGYRSPGSRGGPSMGREDCAGGAGVGNFNNPQHGRTGSPTAGFYGLMSRPGYLSPGSGGHNRWPHLGQY